MASPLNRFGHDHRLDEAKFRENWTKAQAGRPGIWYKLETRDLSTVWRARAALSAVRALRRECRGSSEYVNNGLAMPDQASISRLVAAPKWGNKGLDR